MRTRTDIVARRLHNQRVEHPGSRSPVRLVEWFGAVQAQEYGPARWGLGLRLPEGTLDTDITRAFDTGRLLRTHVLRPTWHFVTPADIRWMLELTAPRIQNAMRPYNRALELDPPTLARAIRVCERVLRDGRHLTRLELSAAFREVGIEARSQRLAHLVMHAELEGVICSGPRRGSSFTYGLLAERAPGARRLDRDTALATLTRRFFRSHGPATVKDAAWWSGLPGKDITRGLDIIRAKRHEMDGLTYWSVGRSTAAAASPRAGSATEPAIHLLPIYDEYLVAYRDRVAVPHGTATDASGGGAVLFQHVLLIDGKVAGTWRLRRPASAPGIDVYPRVPLAAGERAGVERAAERYARFLGVPVDVTVR